MSIFLTLGITPLSEGAHAGFATGRDLPLGDMALTDAKADANPAFGPTEQGICSK